MVFVETSFPRGGTVPASKSSSTSDVTQNVDFGPTTFKRKKEKLNKKQRDEKRKNEIEEKDEQIEAISAELLSLKTITEGMVIMGCISKIDPTYLLVSLPGRIAGKVLVTSISKSYVNIVNKYVNDVDNVQGYKNLEELFHIGQIVCVKVMKVETVGETKVNISLSMCPSDVQSDFHHKQITKGMILCVAVEDIEDHGFVIESGIANLRAFLPSDNVSSDAGDFGVGQNIFCRVEQLKKADSASTAILKTITFEERKIKKSEEISLSYILPSMRMRFKITKILPDGLQGSLMNGTFTGYINEHQLDSPTAAPEDYEVDQELVARVLYVQPITKFVYLSLNLDETIDISSDGLLKVGTIIEQAKIVRVGTGGLIVKLNKTSKGLVNLKSLRLGVQTNVDTDDIMAKYHKNSYHRVRITGYDYMDSLYICSVNESTIDEKFFTLDDVDIGDYVDAKITYKLNDGGYGICVGNIKGYIEKLQISVTTAQSKMAIDSKLRCRVLRKNARDNKIFLTNRKEFMSSDALLLKSHAKAVVGLEYHGMISKIYADGYLVSFCNYVKGKLFRKNLTESDITTTADFFYEGQIAKFRVMFVSGDDSITLGLSNFVCQTGTILQGKIQTINEQGFQLAFVNSEFNGFAPKMSLSHFPSLVPQILDTYKPNEMIDVVCLQNTMYSLRDVKLVQRIPVKHWSDLGPGDIVPAYVKNVSGEVIELYCLIEGFTKIVKIHSKMLLENYAKGTQINLVSDQLLFVRVLGKNSKFQHLTCTARLSDVWRGDLNETELIYQEYFRDIERIRKYWFKQKNPLAALELGSVVKGLIQANTENDTELFVKLPNNVRGVVAAEHFPSFTPNEGDEIDCLIIWQDFSRNVAHVTIKRKYTQRPETKFISKTSKLFLNTARGFKCDVLMILDDFIVVYPRKLTNDFIYIPTRFHHNDLQPILAEEALKVGDLINVTLINGNGTHYIGMLEHIYKGFEKYKFTIRNKQLADAAADGQNLNRVAKNTDDNINSEDDKNAIQDDLFYVDTIGNNEDTPSKYEKKSTKRKLSKVSEVSESKGKKKSKLLKNISLSQQVDGAMDDLDASSDESEDDEQDDDTEEEDSSSDEEIVEEKGRKTCEPIVVKPQLPGVRNFWSTQTKNALKHPINSSSSDDDDDTNESKNAPTKKQKLTPAERFAANRAEESRIRKIEETNANPFKLPSTTDHFERLVMASPDSSLEWINYMVFHMQSNETDKARTVARRALKKINYREETELLNIWAALLNLELRFGDKQSFDSVVSEALLLCDQFAIYSKCVQILADVKRVEDLTEMIATFTKKFRAKLECWSLAATAYFEVGLEDKAKQLLNRALASLPERDHINTIVKFATLSNKYNNKNNAHALMEQILTSYPKRVDCWSQYVDMLVKDSEIELARQILERSVAQRIPMKKMRTLFKKYLDFEEKYGNEINVKNVKAMAANYIEKEIGA